jgi:hypothetical protein
MPSLISKIRAILCCSAGDSPSPQRYGYSARRQGTSRQSSTASGIPSVRTSWAKHSSASSSSHKSRASGPTLSMNVQSMVNRAPKECLPPPRDLTRSLAFSIHDTNPREFSSRLSGNRPPAFGATIHSDVDRAARTGRVRIPSSGNDDGPRLSLRWARWGKMPEPGSPISPPFQGNRGIDPTERLVPRAKSSDSFKTKKANVGMAMQDLRDLVNGREAEESRPSGLKKAFQDVHNFWDNPKSESANPTPGPSQPYRAKPRTYEAPRHVPPPFPGRAPGGITIKKW